MKLNLIILTCFVAIGLIHCAVEMEVKELCPKDVNLCKVDLVVRRELSMMLSGPNATAEPVIYKDGKFMMRILFSNQTGDCMAMKEVTEEEMEKVNFINGLPKFVYTVNNKMPGPTLVFHKGQMVEVTVTNRIPHEELSIHWHGIIQRGTPYMDGVPGVSQCPIHSGETFTYRFKAEPSGTRWYHSHVGLQRTDGLFGQFIVLDEEGDKLRGWEFEKDFVLTFHDWMQEQADLRLYAKGNGLMRFLKDGFDQDGPRCTGPLITIVVNGRGYMYKEGRQEPEVPVPLTVYTVQSNKRYRFRMLNSGHGDPLKVHVDKHKQTVIATDGSPLAEFEVDYVAMHTGERYDSYIETNQPPGLYWIRVEFLESQAHPGLAILRYEEYTGNDTLPSSNHSTCTAASKCVVANCPFQRYLPQFDHFHLICKNLEEMTSHPATQHQSMDVADEDIEEHHFMFEFTVNPDDSDRQSVNGRHFVPPLRPPQVHHIVDFDNACDKAVCDAGPCACTYMVEVTKAKVIQLVLLSADAFFGHPMHLHGHDFEVIKMAYQPLRLDEVDKRPRGVHPDVICNTAPQTYSRCTNPTWANTSWAGNGLPGTNLVNPPLKDTVSIPRGAYAVIRFKADNPGWWMLHCHIGIHLEHGMALLIQEGTPADMPPTPYGFSTCGSFRFPAAPPDEQDPTTHSTPQSDDKKCVAEETTTLKTTRQRAGEVIAYVGCVVGGCFVGALLVYGIFKYQEMKRQQQQTAPLPEPDKF